MAVKKPNTDEVQSAAIISFKRYAVTIEGQTPLIMNKLPESLNLTKAEKPKAVDHVAEDRKNWRDKLYCYDDGMIYLPQNNIKKCLCDGAAYWGAKVEGSKRYTTLVIHSVIVPADMPLGIHRDEEDVNILDPFKCFVNLNPTRRGGGKGPRTRPRISRWGGTFELVVCDARLDLKTLKIVADFAGMQGIGDFRGIGGFGKFKVTNLTEATD
ncbi:MAG: hypothetical protein LUE17_12065 [Planctomycetaceae bacterium]|nr:hypothetical protein [Planctomycetaceae bacterium]